MPLQNRVTPWGELEAVPARGRWLGNRGILHDAEQQVVTRWRSKAWITCRLHWRDVHRSVFSPHTWSELFFLDEATALAAGHRPCAYCRRRRYREFRTAWLRAGLGSGAASLHAPDMDARLHQDRVGAHGGKRVYVAPWAALPEGVFVARGVQACLIWRGCLWPWSHCGYGEPLPAPAADARLPVLTPRCTVALIAAGFRPQVHESAFT